MSKQLRLEVAELTDVGRRRDSNEDNLTRLVPKDPKLMDQKGAIFVVADGMGGHAAGEVASEIAVETIREEYYDSASEDVAEALLRAIKQANQVIYERATEQAGRAGMGTTCVAVVARGGVAYIANVGDSRVYLIRDGQIRQVTNDHSWVAEQVRAGMLTEEQARTHAHRNVITRALGTQPEVDADLFIEPIQDGDLFLLCSDGLSGPVPDPDLNRIVLAGSPQEAVRDLIAQANEQGGPDNITAVLIHVLEAPPLEPEMQERLATIIEAVKEQTEPLKPVKKPRKKISPLALAMRIFIAVALLFISLFAWDYLLGPQAWTRAAHSQLNTDLSHATALVAQAKKQPPDQAINILAAAQHPLLADLQNSSLSADDRQRAASELQQTLAPAIRQALQQYNDLARVSPLSTLSTQHLSISCSAAPGGQLDALVAVKQPAASSQSSAPAAGPPLYFARAHSDKMAAPLYALAAQGTGQSESCGSAVDSAVVDLSVDGSTLYLLHEVNDTTFSIEQITVGADGSAAPEQSLLTLPPGAPASQPILLVVRGEQRYVLYRGANDTIYQCSDTTCAAMGGALPVQVRSMAIGPNNALYLLLANGSLAAFSDGALHAVNLSLLPVLPVAAPDAFDVLTPLPTVPATATFPASTPPPGATATASPSASPTYTPVGVQLTNATLLVSDAQNHLFIGDRSGHRIIQLNPPATASGDPTPDVQYADPSALDGLLSVSVIASDQSASMYALSGHTLLAVTLP
ncbi:MAG TPA: Stp1/IreP family PP2C-type Ser/Thr phosphatase [Ktedonobacterales bacterium]|nr:Stp1/IreP family PP2C-type Ser/Thr phosphatase [Ktedonobacterales bacterium]